MGASNAKHAGKAATLVVRRCSNSTGVEAPRGCLKGCAPAHSRSFLQAPASTDDSPCDGGVFSPSRTHPTVARLISDLKGEAPHGTRAPLSVHLLNALLHSCVPPFSTFAVFRLRWSSSSAYCSLSFATISAPAPAPAPFSAPTSVSVAASASLRRLLRRFLLLLRLRLPTLLPIHFNVVVVATLKSEDGVLSQLDRVASDIATRKSATATQQLQVRRANPRAFASALRPSISRTPHSLVPTSLFSFASAGTADAAPRPGQAGAARRHVHRAAAPRVHPAPPQLHHR